MPRPLALVLALALLVPAVHAAPPPDVEVTICGQVLPKKTLGYLTADLDCTGFTGGPSNVNASAKGAAVYMAKKSRLDLRGFTITGGRHGVLCDVLQCRNHLCPQGTCEVFNGTLVASDPNGRGIMGSRPVVHDITLRGFSFGIDAYKRLILTNATVDDSGAVGVTGKALTITNSSVTDSGAVGVLANRTTGHSLRLTDSTVTGSGTDPVCTQSCADIAASKEPRLVNTTCDTSFAIGDGGSWGVCALD